MRTVGMIALIAFAAACQPDAPKASGEHLFPEDGRKSLSAKPGTVLMQLDENDVSQVVLDTRNMTPAEVEAFLEREKKTQ